MPNLSPGEGDPATRDQRAHVVVRGRVQGVWFRESCRREAEALGVHGWIRNRGDGAVEAVFEGAADAVRELVAWCEIGPPRAHVEKVEASWGRADGDAAGPAGEPPAARPGFRVL